MTNPEAEKIQSEYAEYAYVVSHDLGAPIRQIKSFLSLLMDELPELSDDQKTCKQMIHRAITNAEDMMAGMLKLSRLNTYEMEKKDLNIDDILKDVCDNVAPVSIVIKNNAETVHADKALLSQALIHLIDNAIKFKSQNRDLVLKIAVEKSNHNKTKFTVSDNGIGIEPEYYDRVFVPLRQLHAKGQYSGCGIGLTLSKKIVELHDGYIEIQSIPDTETNIVFEI